MPPAPHKHTAAGAGSGAGGGGNGRRGGRQYQDVNHLLGFTLPPRPPPPPPSSGPRRSARRAPGWTPSFDKDRYVLSNFRFVMKPTSDYTAHFADADIRFDWDDILQVIVDTTSALANASTATIDQPTETNRNQVSIPSCPICLSPPTAPRMTKCGHVYCLPCLLHYLALADGTKWRKCPVCWDAVYAKDLRPVKWHDPVAASALVPLPTSTSDPTSVQASTSPPLTISPFNITPEPLKMRLVRRPQLTTLAFPRSVTWPSDAVPPLRAPWEFTPDALNYAKFVLGSPDYVKDELDGDLKALEKELATLKGWAAAGENDLGLVFVQAAIERVKEDKVKTQEMKTQWVMTARKKALRELAEIKGADGKGLLGADLVAAAAETSSSEVEEDTLDHSGPPTRQLSGLSLSAPTFVPGSAAPPPIGGTGAAGMLGRAKLNRKSVNAVSTPLEPDSAFFFYQAASGQRIFLHPLDIRILKSHFGTYEGMPDTIQVLVEGSDEGTMNDELRRRCRWLSHLPAAADVVFIEADLSRVVSRESLEPYGAALKMRRNKRKDKAKKEDKAKLKSEQREAEERPPPAPVFTYDHDAYFPPAAIYSAPTTAFLEPHSFPPPSATSGSPPNLGSIAGPGARRTVWGTQAITSAAAADGTSHDDSYHDEFDFDERWHDFEENLRGGGGGSRRGNSSPSASTGANAGGGRTIVSGGGGGGGKKKKTKLVLNLTGASSRGSG